VCKKSDEEVPCGRTRGSILRRRMEPPPATQPAPFAHVVVDGEGTLALLTGMKDDSMSTTPLVFASVRHRLPLSPAMCFFVARCLHAVCARMYLIRSTSSLSIPLPSLSWCVYVCMCVRVCVCACVCVCFNLQPPPTPRPCTIKRARCSPSAALQENLRRIAAAVDGGKLNC
jgi:hypothetical protein